MTIHPKHGSQHLRVGLSRLLVLNEAVFTEIAHFFVMMRYIPCRLTLH